MCFQRNIYLLLGRLEARRHRVRRQRELNAAEWHATPIEKASGAVENASSSGWPGGEEGWRVATLEHGGEREDNGRSSAVESIVAAWSR
jgi:hypothetical protein